MSLQGAWISELKRILLVPRRAEKKVTGPTGQTKAAKATQCGEFSAPTRVIRGVAQNSSPKSDQALSETGRCPSGSPVASDAGAGGSMLAGTSTAASIHPV